MTKQTVFVETAVFADAAGISLRNAQKALKRAFEGKAWNKHTLEVRAISGRGGRGGSNYQVNLHTLPESVASRIAVPKQPDLPLTALSSASKNWKEHLILAVIAAGPAKSGARGAKISELAAFCRHQDGKKAGQPVASKTLRGWVAAYEAKGLMGIVRGRRADRGKDRTIVSRAWDRAMTEAGVSEERQREISAEACVIFKSLWKSGVSSASNALFLAGPDLRDLLRPVAPALDRAQLDVICRLPMGFVRRHQRARLAHKKRTDAGGHAANMVPRIRRDRSGLQPCEMVAADVRHSDIFYRRADGSEATAKMIVFLDLGSNRIFARVHLMNKGEMIRREHVLAAFRDLFCDPSWGVPQQLYLDNGGEFRMGQAADDIASIAQLVRDTHAIEMGIFDTAQLPAKTGRLLSRPYNPQSKVIEGVFSTFTRSVEPMCPGFSGGTRMAPKVENQGRKKEPMPGDEVAIQAEYRKMVAFYNAKPQQRGAIKGKSPNQAFDAHVAAGWKSIVCLPGEFTLAFGKDHVRQVSAGGQFQFANETYRHDALSARVGERIRIRVPILDAGGRIPVMDDKGDVLCIAALEASYGMRDLAGAHEQARRNKALNGQIAAEEAGAPSVSLGAKIERAVAEMPTPAVPEQLAEVSIHPALRAAAQADGAAEERAAVARTSRAKKAQIFADMQLIAESGRAA